MATKNIVPRANNEGQLGTETKKWNKQIATTGSFDYISGSLRTEDVQSALPSNLVSGSSQLASYISGSFTSVSSSLSTRVTNVESELENTLVSASAQLADEISGSFNKGFEFEGTISGSSTSTGSFGRVESTSISITSTGSFGRIEATSISASLVEVDADTLRVGGEPMNKTLLQNIKRAHSSTAVSPVGKHKLTGDISGSLSSTGSFGHLLIHGERTSGTNTGDVTIATGMSTPDYITISNQEITPRQIDLTTDVTGVLPSANLDSDTAHLSGTQTFSGAKTFSSALTTAAINSSGDITTTGNITAQNFIVSSSVTNLQIATLSGSTEFGDDITDTHQFTGSVFITGSTTITETLTTTNIGAFTAAGAIDFNSQEMTNVNIDTGDISTGTTINKSPVITLGGDLSGNATLNRLGDATLTATIAADSVEGTMLNTNVADTSTIELSSDTLSVLKVPNALTVDNATIGLNSGTTFDGSGARTISVKDGGIDADALASSVAGSGLTGGSGSALAVGAGTGITVNTNDVAIRASQTAITSVKNNSLVIGGDSQNNTIDFGTDDVILFDTDNTERMRVDAAGVDVTGAITSTGAIIANGDISGSSTSTGSFGAVVTPTYGRTISNITEIIEVTVVDDGGNHYAFEGATTPNLVLSEGKTYRFDQSDTSNDGHPFRFSTTQDGTHDISGAEYTTGVTSIGTPGVTGAYTEIKVTKDTANKLYYYCTSHSGMGNDGQILKNDLTNFGGNISGSSSSTGSFGHILVDGTNIETFISSSASTFGFSGGGTSDYETLDNVPENIISSSGQIATAISGAFTNGFEFNGTISGSVTSTGSFGHIMVGGNNFTTAVSESAAASGFGTGGAGGGDMNDLVDDTSPQLGGDLDLNSNDIIGTGNITISGNISGSSTSTGSFERVHITDRLGIGTTTPFNSLHVLTSADNVAKFKSSDATVRIILEDNNSVNNGNYVQVTNDVMTLATNGGNAGLIIDDSQNIEIGGNISGSSTSTGSYGRLETAGASNIGGILSIPGFPNVSSSLAAAVAGGDNLGNHTATQDINLDSNNLINVSSLTATGNISSSLTSTGSFGHLMVDGGNFTSASLASAIAGGGGEANEYSFKTIQISPTGQSPVVADTTTDTLTFAAGSNMTITTDASTDTITFASSGGSGGGTSTSRSVTRAVATAGQTTFNVNYTASLLDVYQNGIKLDSNEVTATNGTSVVLSSGATVNDVLEFVAFETISNGTQLNVNNDSATTSSLSPLFTSVTSGNIITASIDSSKLSYTPSTGKLFTDGGISGSANSTASFGQILLGGEELSAGGGGIIVAQDGYSDTTETSYTLTTSYVAFNSDYYRLTFDAPSSGKVLLHAQVHIDFSSAGRRAYFKWDVQGGSPSTSYTDYQFFSDGEISDLTVHPERIITGLTAGQSYTYDLFARISSTTAYLRWGGDECAPLAYVLTLP